MVQQNLISSVLNQDKIQPNATLDTKESLNNVRRKYLLSKLNTTRENKFGKIHTSVSDECVQTEGKKTNENLKITTARKPLSQELSSRHKSERIFKNNKRKIKEKSRMGKSAMESAPLAEDKRCTNEEKQARGIALSYDVNTASREFFKTLKHRNDKNEFVEPARETNSIRSDTNVESEKFVEIYERKDGENSSLSSLKAVNSSELNMLNKIAELVLENYGVKKKSETRETSTQTGLELKDASVQADNKDVKICLKNCRYDAVRSVVNELNMREVNMNEYWDVVWTDSWLNYEECRHMTTKQKINHFPGMSEICRKELLANNLRKMLKTFPKHYDFFPKTWILPKELKDFRFHLETNRRSDSTYVIKPERGCQGRGIYLTKYLSGIKPVGNIICQVYISRPYLIDGYKWDFRVYALVTSMFPLEIYVYNEGLARFATVLYETPTNDNINNSYMHLTNTAINKQSSDYVTDLENGSKRKITTMNKLLQSNGVDLSLLWRNIDDVIVKTIISGCGSIKKSCEDFFGPLEESRRPCFQILGFDILLDKNLKPYVLEVNHTPSFQTETKVDQEVKYELIRDTFRLLNFDRTGRKEDRKLSTAESSLSIESYKDVSSDIVESLENDIDDTDNKQNLGNFRKVYPNSDNDADLEKLIEFNLSLQKDEFKGCLTQTPEQLQNWENLVKKTILRPFMTHPIRQMVSPFNHYTNYKTPLKCPQILANSVFEISSRGKNIIRSRKPDY